MITYTWKGEPFHSDRDILSELSQKYDTDFIDDGIRNDGYNSTLKIGDPEIAEIEMFFSSKEGTEFAAIAMLSLGDSIKGYVFSKHHDAVVFLKEFAPMVESIINTHNAVNKED